MSPGPRPLRRQCPPRRGRWQTGPHPRPPHSHSRTHSHMHTHRHIRARACTHTHTPNRDAHTLPHACSLLSAPRPPWQDHCINNVIRGPSVLPVGGREPGEATCFIRQKGKRKLRKDPPAPCSTQSPSSLGPCSHTAPQASPSVPRLGPPHPMPTRSDPQPFTGRAQVFPRPSSGGVAWPQLPAPHGAGMCWTRPACQEHLRVLRRQAPHPCLRANPQPSAHSVLPVAPQPLRKQPGVQRDLRARPASQLRERAQPWPRGTLSRALSFVGTPGLWHSWQETLCGECFNKSPFENGIFVSQRARALLRQLGAPHHQPPTA